MNPGRMRNRIIIEKKVSVREATGESVEWTEVDRRWAAVKPLSVRARETYQAIHGEVSHEIRFRDPPALSLRSHRFQWKDKTLEPVEPSRRVVDDETVLVRET